MNDNSTHEGSDITNSHTERKPGPYWVKKVQNSASYLDLDPWEVAVWDDKQGYWLKHGSMGVWPEDYFDEIDPTPITRAPQPETESQEVLWHEVFWMNTEGTMSYEFIENAKEQFIITRKP